MFLRVWLYHGPTLSCPRPHRFWSLVSYMAGRAKALEGAGPHEGHQPGCPPSLTGHPGVPFPRMPRLRSPGLGGTCHPPLITAVCAQQDADCLPGGLCEERGQCRSKDERRGRGSTSRSQEDPLPSFGSLRLPRGGQDLPPCSHVSLPSLGFSEEPSDGLWLCRHFRASSGCLSAKGAFHVPRQWEPRVWGMPSRHSVAAGPSGHGVGFSREHQRVITRFSSSRCVHVSVCVCFNLREPRCSLIPKSRSGAPWLKRPRPLPRAPQVP